MPTTHPDLLPEKRLRAGKQVTALGGSDAHCPDDIGSVWTGVFASRCTASAILAALKQGRCFASESSLLELVGQGQPMGSVLSGKRGRSLRFRYRVADAGGIDSVRIVCNGRVVKEIPGKKRVLIQGGFAQRMPGRPGFCRLESTAADDRRAFSTPIYLVPMPA